ncbi:MAG: hypothetical protein K6G10_13250 [Butyrivibrio sp.]|nr:hypothetical protein [Butyrivibrio sp.]
MKKLKALMFSLICIICLTGCVRFNTTVEVKKNGNLDVTMLLAAVSMADYGMEDLVSSDEMKNLEEQGWTVEEYSQDGFVGFTATRKDISPEELTTSMESTENSFSSGIGSDDISFTREGSKYVLDWKVFDEDDMAQMSAYKGYFAMTGGYMTLTVKLPVEPISSNATKISDDGKTLEWDLLNLGPDNKIHLEFSIKSLIPWKALLIAGIVLTLLIALIIVIIVLAASSNKKKRAAQMQNAMYYTQNMGGAPQGFNPGQYNQPGQGYQPQGYNPQANAGYQQSGTGYQPELENNNRNFDK